MNANILSFEAPKNPILDDVLRLAAKGWRIFPITPGAKTPPVWTKWPERATADQKTLQAHWSISPRDNYGVACGSGLLGLDVDIEKGGVESLEALKQKHGKLPPTYQVRTPSGGAHYYFAGPDVGNSVRKIGAGLDVRSAGGYLCGPGSRTAAGEYVVMLDAPVALAPQWLLELCSTPRAKANTGEPVPPAPADAVERAREWLAKQSPAIEGQGGDAHTFATACGLRDLGMSQPQVLALLAEWNAKCSPPWTAEGLATKTENAFKYADSAPGAKAARLEDFPVIEQPKTGEHIPAKEGRDPRRFLTVHDFRTQLGAPRDYLVQGILGRASYAELFGPPGSGKTFVALDLCYAIAQGRPWMGRKIKQGLVVYIPYEGAAGLRARVQALAQRYGDAPNFRVVENPDYDLRDRKGRQQLAADVATAFGGTRPVLICFDTFAHALMGGDENSAQDVGAFNAGVGGLIRTWQSSVLVLHHPGKDASKGSRGSTALLGAVDTELEITAHAVHSRKQRDWELAEPIGFRLVPMLVGMDEDGEITSCTVEPANIVPPEDRLSDQEKVGMRALETVAPDNAPITEAVWRAEFEATAWSENKRPETAESRRRAFQRVRDSLVEKRKVVAAREGLWQRAMQ